MIPLAAVGIGSGLTMPITAAILGVLPQAQAGVAGGILNAAREASGLLGVTVIGAILTARQGGALAAGATPHAAFLAGYSAGLAAAAALVLVGGVIALRTMPGRVTAATGRPQPGPVQAGPRRIPAAAIPAAAASGAPRYPAAQSRPCAEPSRAAA
jgi:hypothetical protein